MNPHFWQYRRLLGVAAVESSAPSAPVSSVLLTLPLTLALSLSLPLASCVQRGSSTKEKDPVVVPSTSKLTAVVTAVPGTPIRLTAQRMSAPLRDGTSAPMWGFCATSACGGTWAPGPTIVATTGSNLQISLTNSLAVPTSLVILGQLGGGLGAPVKMASPAHSGQGFTTFPANAPVGAPGAAPAFTPPAQAPRVRSFGTEVTPGGTETLTWSNLKAGTYLYETGTLPSLQLPMGLYGVLVVTTPPGDGTPGVAYPGIDYDSDVTLLLSEIDIVQNRAVDAAAQASADVNRRFDDPACTAANPCYPAAVNYAPTYHLINGKYFDQAAPQGSQLEAGTNFGTGNVLVRLLNAGLRTHVPSIVGLPMSRVGEDGNRAPGSPKIENEVLLTAGKTLDVIVNPSSSGSSYSPGTYPVFDRALSLSTANLPSGGMQAFLLINHGAAVAAGAAAGEPGMLPAALVATATNDAFNVPYGGNIGGNVTANDVGVVSVVLGTAPSHGVATLAAAEASPTHRLRDISDRTASPTSATAGWLAPPPSP